MEVPEQALPEDVRVAGHSHESSLFPLWYRSSWWSRRPTGRLDEPRDPAAMLERGDVKFRLLGWLYEHERRSPTGAGEKTQVKSRILWRLMRYERDGDDASLDIFPFITWDRKADGHRRFSFLWRLYRNERTAAGGRNVDVLFVPVLRE